MIKGKALPLQPWTGPEGSRSLRLPEAHEGGKVVSSTHRLPSPSQEVFLVLISVRGWVDPSATVQQEGLCQLKILNDTIGDRTRDLLACSAVPQPTASPKCLWKRSVCLRNSRVFIPTCSVGRAVITVSRFSWPGCTVRHNSGANYEKWPREWKQNDVTFCGCGAAL